MPSSNVQPVVDNSFEPGVRCFLHLPENPGKDGVLLTHGAGGNAQAPLLVALAEHFCEAGFTVLRCDLPFRQVQSWRPPGPSDAARDRAGLKNAIDLLRKRVSGRIFFGGHSYGGRQSSMLATEEPNLGSGLLLLSYPLHPPRQPEQLRTQHLSHLHTPVLFVHGTRDPFGSIPELEQAIRMIPANTRLLAVNGAGHDLGFKGKARAEALPRIVLEEFANFFS